MRNLKGEVAQRAHHRPPNDRPSPSVLGLSATPVINTLMEGRSLVELVTSESTAIGSD